MVRQLIDREKAIDGIQKACCDRCDNNAGLRCRNCDVDMILSMLQNQKTEALKREYVVGIGGQAYMEGECKDER